jgi:hypothetical protein
MHICFQYTQLARAIKDVKLLFDATVAMEKNLVSIESIKAGLGTRNSNNLILSAFKLYKMLFLYMLIANVLISIYMPLPRSAV